MSTPKDGGPAFPHGDTRGVSAVSGAEFGMSLRDWFAGQALNGWAAGRNNQLFVEEDSRHNLIAKACYRYADAMLEERTKTP